MHTLMNEDENTMVGYRLKPATMPVVQILPRGGTTPYIEASLNDIAAVTSMPSIASTAINITSVDHGCAAKDQCQSQMTPLVLAIIKRARRENMGAVTTNRLKPRSEKLKPRASRICGFCGEVGPRANGNCVDRNKDFWSMVPAKDIDQLVSELTRQSSPDFNLNVDIPVESHIFEQVHPDKK